jgi:hypothetical protein
MLYGISYDNSSGDLFRINPANGSLTSVGPSDVSYIDFGSTTSGLFALGFDGNLYSINANTGAPTLIGSTGVSHGTFSSLSTNATTLYLSAGANLYTLNTNTGAATLVGNMGGPEIGALLMEGGVLYGGEDTPASTVDTLDPNTGLATIGPNITGTTSTVFAFAPYPVPVPEPSAWSMIAVGVLALLGVMQRKKHWTA